MRSSRIGQLGVPAAIVFVVVMMVVPLPAFLVDMLLAFNLSAAVVVLLLSMFVTTPLDFSVFPSLLLILTLFRLALNVSVTRLVLLHGYAGKVVEAFGHFTIGGSLVVGLVIFLILIVIQFVVITNGAGRVAEVGARFTLDAMPGKQMAIDADLNAGLINEDEARRRRREVAAEADFYGAMDGASKFVKGDAIAAIIITIINLIGGMVVGIVQRGMEIGDAVSTFSLLSVGDGLVSQIPALLISIAAGLIVTRSASDQDMGSDLISQFLSHKSALQVAAVSITFVAIIPGLPKIPFLALGGGLWIASTRARKDKDKVVSAAAAGDALADDAGAPKRDTPEEIAVEMRVEPLELEIGYGLVDLVDTNRGGDLLDRVRALRRKVAMDLGIVIPPVRTRDSVDISNEGYVIRVHGVEAGRGEAPAGMSLVLGEPPAGVPAQPTKDPVFGMDAAWVPAEFAVHAEVSGSTVIDRGSVITAHLAEVVRINASRIVSRQDVKLLVDTVKGSSPVVVDEMNASGLSLADVQGVLHSLLDEQVPVRDLVRILEAVSARARATKDLEALTEAARGALGPAISAAYASGDRLSVITVDAGLEHALVESLRAGEAGTFLAIDHENAERIAVSVAQCARGAEEAGERPVLVTAAPLRPALRRLLRSITPNLPVLTVSEVGDHLQIETVGVVNLGQPATV